MRIHLVRAIPAIVSLSTVVRGQQIAPQAAAQINAIAAEKAARTPAQKKLQSSLIYLAREIKGQKAVEGAPALRSRSATKADGRVAVEISAPVGAEIRAAIIAAGGVVVYESVRWASIQALLPPAALETIAARADVKTIRQAERPTVHAVTNESDAAHRAAASRPDFGVSGAGIKVGVISDSVDHLAASLSSGELPASLTVLPGRAGEGTGEGTAMLEIVHDIAPDSQLYFAEAGPGPAGFADSITLLRAAGCRIIVDDISYSRSEWQFQDDVIGQAVNQVVDDGAVYLSSSGNEGNKKRGTSTTWEGDFVSGGAAPGVLPSGTIVDFGANNFNRTLADESPSFAVLQWSDEYNTSANDYDLYILSADGSSIVAAGNDTQAGESAPIETVPEVQPGERIVIWKAPSAASRYLRLITPRAKLEVSTAGQTIGHAATAKCICVAASDATLAAPGAFTTASLNEDSSSDGPHRMFYHPNGTPVTPGNFSSSGGVNLQTPAITAGDGGATSVPGFEQFYGTSAAAPAAAAIAALVWSRNPSLTNTQIRTILETSCLDIEAPGFEVNSGNGILMADLALQKTLKPQEIWRKLNFATYLPTGNAATGADPDSDGMTNLQEYALGSSPVVSSPAPYSLAAASPLTSTLAYQLNADATDVTLKFQKSTNLTTWSDLTPVSDELVSTSGSVQTRSAIITKPTGGKEFYRTSVTPQ